MENSFVNYVRAGYSILYMIFGGGLFGNFFSLGFGARDDCASFARLLCQREYQAAANYEFYLFGFNYFFRLFIFENFREFPVF